MFAIINTRHYDVSRSGADILFAPVGAEWTVEVLADGRVFVTTPVREDAAEAYGSTFRGWLPQELVGAEALPFMIAVRNLRGV